MMVGGGYLTGFGSNLINKTISVFIIEAVV